MISKFELQSVRLHIQGDTFPAGASIKCKCTFVLKASTVASEEIFQVKIPIRNVTLEVTPSNGETFKTPFRLHAYGRVRSQTNGPLLFRFGYIADPVKKIRVYITGWARRNSLDDVRLPILTNASSMTMKIFVQVRNIEHTVSYADATVVLVAATDKSSRSALVLSNHWHYLSYDQFKASELLYNYLSIFSGVTALPLQYVAANDTTQIVVTQFLRLFMAHTATIDTTRNMIDLLKYFVEKTGGRMHDSVLSTIRDVFNKLLQDEKIVEFEG